MRQLSKRVCVLFALIFACNALAALTPTQLQVLRADINSDPSLANQPNNADGAIAIAAAYNTLASPTFIVFRSSVSITLVGQSMLSTDIANLTTANTNRLMVIALYAGGTFNPANADTWQGFNDIFSAAGAAGTRTNLLALRKRSATRGEKLFATGTGSDASPGTLTFEGNVTANEVLTARAI